MPEENEKKKSYELLRIFLSFAERNRWFLLIVGVIILLAVFGLLPSNPTEAKEWIDSILSVAKEFKN